MGRLDLARGSPTCNLRLARSPPLREAGPGPTGAANHQPGLEITPLLTPASKTMNLLMGNKCLNQPPPTPTPKGQELLILTHHNQVACCVSWEGKKKKKRLT